MIRGNGKFVDGLVGVDNEILGIDCTQGIEIHGGGRGGRFAIHERSHGLMKVNRLCLGESKNGVKSGGRRRPRGCGRNNGLIDGLVWYDFLRRIKNKGRSSKMGGFKDDRRDSDLVRCVCWRGSKNWRRSSKSERVHGHLRNGGRVLVKLNGLVRVFRASFSWFGTRERLLGCDELRYGVSTIVAGGLNRCDELLVVDSWGDWWSGRNGRYRRRVLRNMGDASDLGSLIIDCRGVVLGREYGGSIRSRGASGHLGR